MRMPSARKAWHDAFNPQIQAIDISDSINEFGVQFSAKGADNRIIQHADKGIVQQAVHQLKQSDVVAWAFGMIAYAPTGTAEGFERATLHSWLRLEFHAATKDAHKNSRAEIKILMLARIAYQDIAHEDVTGERRRRKFKELAIVVGALSAEDYRDNWHKHYVWFREKCKELPSRALSPVSTVLWRCMNLAEAETKQQAEDRSRELRECLGLQAKAPKQSVNRTVLSKAVPDWVEGMSLKLAQAVIVHFDDPDEIIAAYVAGENHIRIL